MIQIFLTGWTSEEVVVHLDKNVDISEEFMLLFAPFDLLWCYYIIYFFLVLCMSSVVAHSEASRIV